MQHPEGNSSHTSISCAHFNMELSFIILLFSGNVFRVPKGFRNDDFPRSLDEVPDSHLLSYSSYFSVPTPAMRVDQDYVKEGRLGALTGTRREVGETVVSGESGALTGSGSFWYPLNTHQSSCCY